MTLLCRCFLKGFFDIKYGDNSKTQIMLQTLSAERGRRYRILHDIYIA